MSATFSVIASDANNAEITYQWEIDTGTGFLPASGATSANFTPEVSYDEQPRSIRVVVSTPMETLISETAELVVDLNGDYGKFVRGVWYPVDSRLPEYFQTSDADRSYGNLQLDPAWGLRYSDVELELVASQPFALKPLHNRTVLQVRGATQSASLTTTMYAGDLRALRIPYRILEGFYVGPPTAFPGGTYRVYGREFTAPNRTEIIHYSFMDDSVPVQVVTGVEKANVSTRVRFH